MANYDFFQNRQCEYFPCHGGADEQTFNCLFCYCPLYPLGENCGGCFTYTEDGIKDCSKCLLPPRRENYGRVLEKKDAIIAMAKKREG